MQKREPDRNLRTTGDGAGGVVVTKGRAEKNTGNEGRQRIKKRLELGKMETGKR